MAKRHQDYDKILRENAERLATILLKKFLGLHYTKLERLATHLPRTIDRRPDFALISTDELGQQTIQHFEFQTKVETKMVKRNLVYYALFHDIYDLPVRQYVIYLGTGKWTAATNIDEPNCQYHFQVICVNDIDYEDFLKSDSPDEIIMAILGNFKRENESIVVKKILYCLQNKEKNQGKLQKYLFQLEVLSNLRNLQAEIKQNILYMPLTYDITKDLRFIEGKEEGREEGREKGREEGKEDAKSQFVLNLLRSTDFDDDKIANLASASVQYVKDMRQKLNA